MISTKNAPDATPRNTRQFTSRRHSHARQPFADICATPCNIIAAGTGKKASKTPIKIIPPAMPRMPEMKEVMTTDMAMMTKARVEGISAFLCCVAIIGIAGEAMRKMRPGCAKI